MQALRHIKINAAIVTDTYQKLSTETVTVFNTGKNKLIKKNGKLAKKGNQLRPQRSRMWIENHTWYFGNERSLRARGAVQFAYIEQIRIRVMTSQQNVTIILRSLKEFLSHTHTRHSKQWVSLYESAPKRPNRLLPGVGLVLANNFLVIVLLSLGFSI